MNTIESLRFSDVNYLEYFFIQTQEIKFTT